MIRVDFMAREDQISYLKKLPGNISEHIRRAIDEYKQSIESKKVSESASKKRGEQNE